MTKRIAIATIGTMGDVLPYLALATELQKRGYSVVFGTNADFEDVITKAGVEFFSLGTHIKDWLQQSGFEGAMSQSLLVNFPSILKQGQDVVERAARNTWKMAQGADAIVVHINTSFGIDIAEALDIPVIMTALQPLNPTREFPICAYQWPNLGPAFNRLSYVIMSIQQAYYDFPRDRLRKELMGLKPRRRGGLFRDSDGNRLPILYNFSAHVSPRPRDWKETSVITGYWRFDDTSDWTPSPEFQAFLDAGPAPVYIGFGSMPFGSARNTQILREAVAAWGGRAVVSKGWGGINATDLPDTFFAIDHAPHDKLFPLMAAVVHHGGAGTTSAGLHAGKPTFVVPQTYDQPYWGRRIRNLGCGPSPVPLKNLTPEKLTKALVQLTGTPAYATNAQAIAKKLAKENGTKVAADYLEATLAGTASRDAQRSSITA
jgi:sterol 3beta-glucosyltransferase